MKPNAHRIVLILVVTGWTELASAAPLLPQAGPTNTLVGPWSSTTTALRVDWPTFGNGPTHTGYYPDVVATGQFTPEWSVNLGEEIQQVAVGAGRVYATPWQYFGDAWLATLDAASGSELWRYTFSTCYSINPPTFADDHVLVQRGDHSTDTQIWSFYADTGIPYWVTPHSAQWERYMAPTVADGKVFVDGGYYGGMYGFQESDGSQLFYDYEPQYDGWTPTYYAGRLYSWVEGVLQQYDPTSGTVSWSLDLGWNWNGWTMGRTSATANGRAFLVGNPNLYAVDLSTRALAWSVNGNFTGTPAVANGIVYAIDGSFVKAYDAWSGSYVGVYVGDQTLIDQPIVTDDAVVFASPSHTYVYDRATYALRRNIPFGGHLTLADGRLFIATGDGFVRSYVAGADASPLPNLVADWEPWDASALPGTVLSTHLSVTNFGSVPSLPCRMVLILSADTQRDAGDRVIRLMPLPSVAPGETLRAQVQLSPAQAPNANYVLAIPDASNHVLETNEANVFPSGRIH